LAARAEEEALAGGEHLVVMPVTYKGKPELFGDTALKLDPQNLTGASRLVYAYAMQEGLNPALVGRWVSIRDSFHRVEFHLVVHW
ncbi:MAG: hypothetical protein KC561_02385, partial [Myxococcales bacterium]|nr:hypothetical protein [Myxococcales bacterium]